MDTIALRAYEDKFLTSVCNVGCSFIQVRTPWVHIMNSSQCLVLAALCDWARMIYGTNVIDSKTAINLQEELIRNDFFYFIPNKVMKTKTGMSHDSVSRILKILSSIGIIELKFTGQKYEQVRYIRLNVEMLQELDDVWRIATSRNANVLNEVRGPVYDPQQAFYQEAINEELSKWDAAVEAVKTVAQKWVKQDDTPPTQVAYPPTQLAGASYKEIRNISRTVSSSKKPGLRKEPQPTPPQGTGGQGTPVFRRKPILDANTKAIPKEQVLDASLEHAVMEVAEHWKSKGTLGNAERRRRGGGADFKYFTTFMNAMKGILGGTFFKGRAKVDPKYNRAYSVAQIKQAIDILAEYPDSIRKNVTNIGDFFWWDNPKTNGFNSGTGQSWFLRALFGDDPRQPVVKSDDYPDITEYITKKYLFNFMGGNARKFTPRDQNHFISTSERIVDFYNAHEETLCRMNMDPEALVGRLMECARQWGKGDNGFAIEPVHLNNDSLFKALEANLLKGGYLTNPDKPEDEKVFVNIYDQNACASAPELTEEEKERNRLYAAVMSWPESVRRDMMIAKGIPLDILDD